MSAAFVGIDVGARELHCAAIDERGRLLDHASVPAAHNSRLADWCAAAEVVAIDAPETPSTVPHAGSAELAPKFRRARCAEIQLGRRHGSWVSWATPTGPPYPAWMEAGFAAYAALRSQGERELLEVYPYAGFRELAGGRRLAKKQTVDGRRERAALLERAGIAGEGLDALSHDTLDALLAARVALDQAHGQAVRVTCGHDDSAIWLPAGATGARQRCPQFGSLPRKRSASA